MLSSLPDMWRLEYDTTEISLSEILQIILWLNQFLRHLYKYIKDVHVSES